MHQYKVLKLLNKVIFITIIAVWFVLVPKA